MNDSPPWLSPVEERAWRGMLRMHDLLVNQAGRTLQSEFGLSATDYSVLAELTRTPKGRLRILELAKVLGWEKSRVSHHIARMAKRGLTDREECADDGRGAYVIVTPAGREAITNAAPRHVEDVRRLFLDHLSPGQITLLAEITDTVIGKIDI
ncbi:MarR family winged helix-turn-helix transcriptional regulator [Streptomyces sp. VRA16 Mangrove soil]|uniref:MarR family winged helix-turn-helix transcriptional regulator n=1 Tax=Streptomyces sp. VRA16 Mangrove soil TaxID=2817434 RepID=UPI001A9CEC93|nr:MarR family transcriptional regulator [Streptomyces sp. VRA16 Mangrove soil]MBO1331231.1 MarR family transcriptional regulator [Streptomyces sp. VRA16 Mangrove soil]